MSNRFEIGDIVTRDGTDRHLVYIPCEQGNNVGVICIEAPSDPWTAIGETELNYEARYSLVARAAYAKIMRENKE